jgi:hypothetical protein
MPQPNGQETQVSGPLAGISIAYKPTGHIADAVFPIITNVPHKAKIPVYPKGAWFRDEAGIRAPGTRANRGGSPIDTIDVLTKEYSMAKEVTDEDRSVATQQGALVLQPDQDAIEFCAGKIDLKKEKRVRDLIVGTTWTDGNVGGEDAEGKWAAGTGNTFLADIKNGIQAIFSKTGIMPNRLIIDLATFLSLKDEPTLTDKIKYTSKESITASVIAAILELEQVLVGKVSYSSAKETKAGTDFTAANIWDTTAGKGLGFLFFAPARPGLKTPSAGYQAQENFAGGISRKTVTWREPAEHQDVYEVSEQTHILCTGADLGYLWKDVLLT